jgi:hypothetical protein
MSDGAGAARQSVEEVSQLAHRARIAARLRGAGLGVAQLHPGILHLAQEDDLELARVEGIGHSC